jgi:hypothetical protein
MPVCTVNPESNGIDFNPTAIDIHPAHHIFRIAIAADADTANVVQGVQELSDITFGHARGQVGYL